MTAIHTLRSIIATACISGVVLTGAGCGSSSTGNALTATMGAAVKVGRARVRSATTTTATSNYGIADHDLVSINLIGNVNKVFNFSFPVYGIATTTHYVIVSGSFVSSTIIDQTSGDPLNCTLYAISKTANALPSDTICLSQVQVGDYNPTFAATDNQYSHVGFATQGNTVYFTDFLGGNFYSWTEGQSVPKIIFSRTIQSGCPGFDDVFVDPNSNNICLLQTAQGTCPSGFIYCGTVGNFAATVIGSPGTPVLAETRRLGSLVVSTTQQIDLATLAVSSRTANGTNGGLPATGQNIAADSLGGQVYVGSGYSLAYLTGAGATCLIANNTGLTNTGCVTASQNISANFQALYGLGTSAWTYGTSNASDPTTGTQLRRIDLTSDTLDSTNYMSAAGMTSINALGYTPSGLIQVTGLNAAGSVVKAYIDSTATISTSGVAPATLDLLVAF